MGGIGSSEQGPRYDDDPFEDTRDRHAFVRKVFMIVGIQLLINVAICIPFIFVEEVKEFSLNPSNRWVMWVCMGVTLVLMIVLGCCQSVRRRFPINLILLFIFTVAQGTIIGFVCGASYPMHVLLALGITCAVCLSLIIFAMQVKWDFTGIAPYLIIGGIILLIMGIVSIFIRDRILMIVICSFGVLLFSIYLIVDVQMMLGGKHKYQFDPEDYVMAAICIYVDIITIFLYILQLLGLTLDD